MSTDIQTITRPKVLVTGGAGFIGSHLVDCLIAEGYPVVVIDNLFAGTPTHLHEKLLTEEDGCRFYQMDIRDTELHRVFALEQPEYVFHLAAQIDLRLSVKDPIHDIDINILGGVNLLKNCVHAQVKKIIFASSGGALYGELPDGMEAFPHGHPGNPVSAYGYSKEFFERNLGHAKDAYGIDYLSLRMANVYGPRQESSRECGVISIFIQNVLQDKVNVINGDGSISRDFVYVGDCVDAFMRGLNDAVSGSYNISTGVSTSINALHDLLSDVSGKSLEKQYVDAKAGDVQKSCLDYSVTRDEIGWEPQVSLREGVEKVLAWNRSEAAVEKEERLRKLYDTGSPYRRCRHWFSGDV